MIRKKMAHQRSVLVVQMVLVVVSLLVSNTVCGDGERSILHDNWEEDIKNSPTTDEPLPQPSSDTPDHVTINSGGEEKSSESIQKITKPENYESIVEGAMKLGILKEQDYEELTSNNHSGGRGATNNKAVRWPYQMLIDIDTDFSPSARVLIEAGIWTLAETIGDCFNFLINPRGRKVKGHKDHLNIVYGGTYDGCSSKLGRIGGRQETVLSDNCKWLYGVSMHEILHVLGFYHEHARPDRDKYVSIDLDRQLFRNNPSKRHQYLIREDQVIYSKEYDFESIMHYPFSNLMQPKVDVPPGVQVGQRDHLSEGDMKRLRKMFPCPRPHNK